MIAATFGQNVTGYAVVFGIVVLVLNQLGVLDWLGLKRRSAADAAAEIEVADRKAARLQIALDAAQARNKVLEHERTNEPVLEVLQAITSQLGDTAVAQVQVLDRLAKHNGSFAHMEQSLGLVAEGLKALMGTIAELHNIPLKEMK